MPVYQSSSSRPYLHVPDGWDTGWKAAKATRASSPVTIGFIGDSMADAQSNTAYGKAFPELLLQKLSGATSRADPTGRYADWWPIHQSPINTANGTKTDNYWGSALNSVTFAAQDFQPGYGPGVFYSTATTSVGYLTFTTPYACTSFDIIYSDHYAGSWQYSVDGAANVTVTNGATWTMKRISITGLSAGTHTFTFGWQTATAVASILGIVTYTGNTGGYSLARCYESGLSYTQNFLNISTTAGTSSVALDKPALWSNKSPQNDATAAGAGTFGFPMGADLLIFQGLVNEVYPTQGFTTPSNVTSAVSRIIHHAARAKPNLSVLFLIPWYPILASDDSAPAQFVRGDLYSTYTQAIYQVARDFNAAVVNVNAKWKSTPKTAGYTATNDIHPSDAGAADIATLMASIL